MSITAIITVLSVFLILYSISAAVSTHGMERLIYYEKKAVYGELNEKDKRKLFTHALQAMSTIRFVFMIPACMPMDVYEIWMFVMFPCLLMTFLPTKSVVEAYQALTQKKAFLIFAELLIFLAEQVLIQTLIQIFIWT